MQSIGILSRSGCPQRTLRARRQHVTINGKKETLRVVCRVAPEKKVEVRLSPVVRQLKPSKTAALSDLAKSMISEGKDVISLAVGEPDFPTPEYIAAAAVEAIQEGFTKYTQTAGIPPLRTAICNKLKRENGLDYTEDCIVVSNGAKQAACQAVLATCGEGDEVLIPAPYWVSYPEMSVWAGATPKLIPCPISEGFLLTAKSLEQSLTEKSRLLILCTPSNPTGAMYSREQLMSIADVVGRHPSLLVLSDEIYEYMTYGSAEHVSFASLPGMYERTLTINGFSKGFAMTGWRLGYLAAPQAYARACENLQSLAALKMGHRGGSTVADMVKTYQDRRDYVVKRLKGIPGVHALQPDGAFYVFPDVSAFVGNAVQADGFGSVSTTEQLCMFLLERALVALMPGDAFGAPGHLRISYATSQPLLEKALDRIEEALAKVNRQSR